MNTNQNSQTIRASKSEGLAGASKSRFFGALFQRLRPHLFLLSQSLWLLGLVALWRTFSSQLYEAFQSLPVIDQYVAVAAASVFCFLFAATVREFRTDFGERWAARIVGACGVAVLLSFSFRMTMQVNQLKSQIASKEIASAKSIASQSTAEAISGRPPEAVATSPLSHVRRLRLQFHWNQSIHAANRI